MFIPQLFVFGLGALGFGGFIFFKGFGWMKQKRLIENTPTSKVRSIAMGQVEVFGEAIANENRLIKSPLSNSDCVYYKYSVMEHRGSGKNSRWVVVKKGEERAHFYLKDETGLVLVDPADAEIDIPADFQFDSSWGKDPPETVKNFLRANNLSFEGWLGINKRMHYTEFFIAPGDRLYIMGSAGDNPFVEEGAGEKNEADIMLQKGAGAYLISDKSEKEVLQKFFLKTVGGLLGGTALIIIGLLIVFANIGIL
ncbi:MAG: GIDE domain-containing protein [Candidatus Diapherotrites archaeon]